MCLTGFREGVKVSGFPNSILFACSDHTFPYFAGVQATLSIWDMQIARHTLTHTHSPVCWRIWMNNYHDMQRRTKAANMKRNFITFAWVFWFTTPLGRPRQLWGPAAAPLTPLPHIYEFTFLARDPTGCTGVDTRAQLKRYQLALSQRQTGVSLSLVALCVCFHFHIITKNGTKKPKRNRMLKM